MSYEQAVSDTRKPFGHPMVKRERHFKCSLCGYKEITTHSGMPLKWTKLNISERWGRGSGRTSAGATFLSIHICGECRAKLPDGKRIETKWIAQIKTLMLP